MADGLPIPDAEIVLVVPPIAEVAAAPLSPHLLQAVAQAAGIQVGVFYANIAFAQTIGLEAYERISVMYGSKLLIGERLFSEAAFGIDSPRMDGEPG